MNRDGWIKVGDYDYCYFCCKTCDGGWSIDPKDKKTNLILYTCNGPRIVCRLHYDNGGCSVFN